MRTKHVLMTTALLSLFAACTNDDFVSYEQGAQSGDAALRPSVDVTLNVSEGNGADTRLTFIPGEDKGYLWQTNDTIGALLMDKVIAKNGTSDIRPHDDIEKWEEMAWTSRYELVDYINTNYPFVRQSDGTWQTNAKMLEGNYFFTFPFAAYNGNREAIHSIGEQVQDGTSTASLQEAYAKNQFFIGYARIHAGTEGGDVMSADLEMTPVLGAVAVKIKNTGTQDFTVKKIVLQSGGFSTLIKVDPTMAKYMGEDGNGNSEKAAYNIAYNAPNPVWGQLGSEEKAGYFNYANYEESYANDFEERFATAADIYSFGDLVNNTEKSVNYNRKNALRAVMNGIDKNAYGQSIDGADNRAELTVLNAPVQKGNNPEVIEQFVIMTNIYEYDSSNAENSKIDAYIYTDRGMVGPVTISNVKGEMESNEVTVITENPIVKIAPDEINSVTLEIDDNSVQKDFGMEVYNESDLLQLIQWNQSTARVYTATLQNNVTLTKEMTDLLTNGTRSRMFINTNGNKLTIAKGAAANVLDYVLVSGEDKVKTDGTNNTTPTTVATIVVENDLTLGSTSFVNGDFYVGNIHEGRIVLKNELEVAEGGSLTVATPIEYETTRGDYQKQELVIAENEGKVTIAANAPVEHLTIAENKADVTINANVTFTGSSENMENATITIGKGAVVSAANRLINKGKNDYEPSYEDADFAVIYNNGTINNLKNQEYGKVIAGEGSTTNVEENEGEIDKSADIKAVVSVQNNVDKGVISYTVKDEKTLKEIIDSKITKLVIDGGEVEGTPYNVNTPATHYTAKDVKWIEVKGQGGSLGSLIENRGAVNQNYYTSLFPNVIEVKNSANATLTDITFGASSIDFNIEAAMTSIKGIVKAENADVVLGSYDKKNYKDIEATLNIPGEDDELYVKSITANKYLKGEKKAKVSNQGKIELPFGITIGTDVVVEGVGTVNGENPSEGQKIEVSVDADGNYDLNLADLDGKHAFSKVKSVTIQGSKTPDKDQYAILVTAMAGKELILDDKATLNLDNGNGTLSVNKLTVKGYAAVGYKESNPSVMLTVNTIEVAENANFRVYDSYIEMATETGVTSGYKGGVTIRNGGKISYFKGGAIIAKSMTTPGAMLTWDVKTNEWK